MRSIRGFLFAVSLVAGTALRAQEPAPSMQKAPDERAWISALSVADPAARIAAYDDFVKTYPKSKHVDRARSNRFHLLLEAFPERTDEIEKAAKEDIASDGKGFSRLSGEAEVAERLAEAGTHGILLPQAEKWATHAEHHLNEAKWTAGTVKMYVKYKVKAPAPAELHKSYLAAAANIHLGLADVYLHEGKLAQAKPLLDEALAAQPGDMTTNAVWSEYELAMNNKAEALAYFERAAVGGDNAEMFSDLAQKYRPTLLSLYGEANGGSESGLDAALDARYKELFPAPFTPGTPTAVAGEHTALLELFTGSGCPPCVGADYAFEALLNQGPRAHLIAISFDQHIPRPDPLANADSLARASVYKAGSTPTFVLDGTQLAVYGSYRDGAAEIYKKLEHMTSEEASAASDVSLALAAPVIASDHTIKVMATVKTGSQAETTKLVSATKPTEPPKTAQEQAEADAAAAKQKPKAPKPAPKATATVPAVPKLVVNFALVEDEVRYSGENGLRFHRMVVRALAQPADGGTPVGLGTSSTAEASFDPEAVSTKLGEYLASYAKANDRFGPLQWRNTPTALDPHHLYVVAWVQDLGTHRVLQAAMTPALFPQTSVEAKGAE